MSRRRKSRSRELPVVEATPNWDGVDDEAGYIGTVHCCRCGTELAVLRVWAFGESARPSKVRYDPTPATVPDPEASGGRRAIGWYCPRCKTARKLTKDSERAGLRRFIDQWADGGDRRRMKAITLDAS